VSRYESRVVHRQAVTISEEVITERQAVDMRRCEQCETTIHTRATTGRWRRFCSNACRQKAYRDRLERQADECTVAQISSTEECRPPAGVQRPAPFTGRCPYGTEPLDEALKQQLLQS
jgi:ferredoxin